MSSVRSFRYGGEDVKVREMPRMKFKSEHRQAYEILERLDFPVPTKFFVSGAGVPFFVDEGLIPEAYVWTGSVWRKV